MKSRRRKHAFEPLESRQLLAVDLVVEHDPLPIAEPGEEVTRVIRVHNLGDEVAEGTLIRSTLSNELVDASVYVGLHRGHRRASDTPEHPERRRHAYTNWPWNLLCCPHRRRGRGAPPWVEGGMDADPVAGARGRR